MTEQRSFEASKYLTKFQGKDYLEVKWRLLWLRTEHPEALVETELVRNDESFALFKATVSIPNGGSATGWGSETVQDFRDFIEKAETKALGRALAALGYGTQFCEDFAFASHDNGHVVDSPVETMRYRSVAAAAPVRPGAPIPSNRSTGPHIANLATAAQVRAIYTIARDQFAMSETQVEERSVATYGCPPAELTRKQASEFISALKDNGPK